MIVQNLFKFMIFCVISHDPNAIALLLTYKNLEEMLFKTMLKSENILIRTEVNKRLKEMISSKSQKPEMKNILPIISLLLFKVQPLTEDYDSRCLIFYEGIASLIESLSQSDILDLEI